MSIITPMVRPMARPMVTAMGKGGQRTPAQIIQSLFAQGQQGFWLPFTDFASLSQDSAGTLPYTAVEQPVGRVLDRSGRGNHASQVTSTARGVVSARVNLLQKTEDFGVSPWVALAGVTVQAGARISPTGDATMTLLTHSNQGVTQALQQVFGCPASTDIKMRVALAKNSTLPMQVKVFNGSISVSLSTVVVSFAMDVPIISSRVGVIGEPTLTQGPNDTWYLDFFMNSGSYSSLGFLIYPSANNQAGGSVYVWGASASLASQSALPYQRVTTATDYDSVGFPKHLRLDGTDDFYTCNGGGSTTGFYYSDVVQINAGGIIHTLYREATGGLTLGYSITVREDNKIACHVGLGAVWTVVYSTSALVVGTKYHVAVVDDKTNVYMIVNGVVEASIPSPAIVSGGSTISLGRISPPSGGFHLNGQITEPIYRAGPPPSEHERGVIRAYQMQKAGMA